MTQYSYSRVDLYNRCPYHFKIKYLDHLTELPDYSATSPLLLGHALHTGIETDKDTMLKEYFNSYPIITDDVITESIKLEFMLKKVKDWLKKFDGLELIHEFKIDVSDYIGYVDLIVKASDGTCMIVDFKYSNSINDYKKSEQLHIYKWFLEQEYGFKINRLGYLFVEKVNIRRFVNKKTRVQEDLFHYRKRLSEALDEAKLTFVPIEYDEQKVFDFFTAINGIEQDTSWIKNPTDKCFICNAIKKRSSNLWTPFSSVDYLETQQNENGEILKMINKRTVKKVIWVYGAPFTGKTTFASEFPKPLMINTDGNTKFIDIEEDDVRFIADEVTKTGRVTTRKLAWDTLDELIQELEADTLGYQTVVIDLVEDVYNAARYKIYEQLGIDHEADNNFKAWDMVTTLFLNLMKRIVALKVDNIVFLSHEDATKDITKRSGDKVTSIQPNLREKVATKLAGMTDLVGRLVVEDDERKLQFRAQSYVFTGVRIPHMPTDEIELSYEALEEVYQEAFSKLKKQPKKSVEESTKDESEQTKRSHKTKKERVPEDNFSEEIEDDETPPGETPTEEEIQNETPKRKRRTKITEETPTEEEPERPRRKRRTQK